MQSEHPSDPPDDRDELRRENEHLRQQLDGMTGDWLSHAYASAGTMTELQKKRQGFSAISSLQRELLLDTPLDDVIERAMREAVRSLDLDRGIVLAPTDLGWHVVFHLGFDAAEAAALAGVALELSVESILPGAAMIVNRETPSTPFIETVAARFSLPYFVAHPVTSDGESELYLIAGRMDERPPFRPPLDEGDLDTFRAIAGLIGVAIQNRNVAELREQLLRAEIARHTIMENERARIARDMHDEIGARLTQVAMMSELARTNGDSGDDRQLKKIAATSREAVDTIGEIIWAIDPLNDSLDTLAAYLREYCSDYFEYASMRCRIAIPSTLPPIPLSAEFRRNLFLIVKEALHNAVKYSEASDLILTLSLDAGQLQIIVEDTGQGFCTSAPSRIGNGLRNMHRRIAEIGGTLAIESRAGCGTRVSIGIDTGTTPGSV